MFTHMRAAFQNLILSNLDVDTTAARLFHLCGGCRYLQEYAFVMMPGLAQLVNPEKGKAICREWIRLTLEEMDSTPSFMKSPQWLSDAVVAAFIGSNNQVNNQANRTNVLLRSWSHYHREKDMWYCFRMRNQLTFDMQEEATKMLDILQRPHFIIPIFPEPELDWDDMDDWILRRYTKSIERKQPEIQPMMRTPDFGLSGFFRRDLPIDETVRKSFTEEVKDPEPKEDEVNRRTRRKFIEQLISQRREMDQGVLLITEDSELANTLKRDLPIVEEKKNPSLSETIVDSLKRNTPLAPIKTPNLYQQIQSPERLLVGRKSESIGLVPNPDLMPSRDDFLNTIRRESAEVKSRPLTPDFSFLDVHQTAPRVARSELKSCYSYGKKTSLGMERSSLSREQPLMERRLPVKEEELKKECDSMFDEMHDYYSSQPETAHLVDKKTGFILSPPERIIFEEKDLTPRTSFTLMSQYPEATSISSSQSKGPIAGMYQNNLLGTNLFGKEKQTNENSSNTSEPEELSSPNEEEPTPPNDAVTYTGYIPLPRPLFRNMDGTFGEIKGEPFLHLKKKGYIDCDDPTKSLPQKDKTSNLKNITSPNPEKKQSSAEDLETSSEKPEQWPQLPPNTTHVESTTPKQNKQLHSRKSSLISVDIDADKNASDYPKPKLMICPSTKKHFYLRPEAKEDLDQEDQLEKAWEDLLKKTTPYKPKRKWHISRSFNTALSEHFQEGERDLLGGEVSSKRNLASMGFLPTEEEKGILEDLYEQVLYKDDMEKNVEESKESAKRLVDSLAKTDFTTVKPSCQKDEGTVELFSDRLLTDRFERDQVRANQKPSISKLVPEFAPSSEVGPHPGRDFTQSKRNRFATMEEPNEGNFSSGPKLSSIVQDKLVRDYETVASCYQESVSNEEKRMLETIRRIGANTDTSPYEAEVKAFFQRKREAQAQAKAKKETSAMAKSTFEQTMPSFFSSSSFEREGKFSVLGRAKFERSVSEILADSEPKPRRIQATNLGFLVTNPTPATERDMD